MKRGWFINAAPFVMLSYMKLTANTIVAPASPRSFDSAALRSG